jgi:hypothetical protein
MSATLEVKYFNSFWIKKIKSIVDAGDNLVEDLVPGAYPASTTSPNEDWYIEEARIRGGYNNTSVDFGVKAYLVEEETRQQHRFNSIIYSDIFNSRTGINRTNVFSVGEDITKSADPANGSIQKLYAEDTNLILLQEDKVSRALIDKDAIYSAEGNAAVTSSTQVMGQIVPYAGNYGISTNPESFAVYGYRKYFTDRKRNAVLRLSMDGLTEISSYGMQDFFRDELGSLNSSDNIIGGWDIHNKNYTVSIQQNGTYKTLTFDDSVNGWTSFLSFKPGFIFSLNTSLYSTHDGKIWQHYTFEDNSTERGRFYNTSYDSSVEFVFNSNQSLIKNFKTINYEGSKDWQLGIKDIDPTSDTYLQLIGGMSTSTDSALPITKAINILTQASSLVDLQNQLLQNNFKVKENKYFANLINNTISQPGEVLWGQDASGIKGFFATVQMSVDNTLGGKKELFAVSTNYVESSY